MQGSSTIKNQEVAAIFNEIADILDIKGANPFRIRAYRKAAQNMDGMAIDHKIQGLPGIKAKTEQNILKGREILNYLKANGLIREED